MRRESSNYDNLLGLPVLIAMGVCAVAFGLVPGLGVGILLGILAARLARAVALSRHREMDLRLEPFAANGRFLTPVPSVAALIILSYGLLAYNFGRSHPGLWSALASDPRGLALLFPPTRPAVAEAVDDRAFVDHLLRVSILITAAALPFMWAQLRRSFEHGWDASGIVFNSLVAAQPMPFRLLVLVRGMLLLGSAALLIATGRALLDTEFHSAGSLGPFVVIGGKPGERELPILPVWNLIATISMAGPLVAAMGTGFVATILWRARHGSLPVFR